MKKLQDRLIKQWRMIFNKIKIGLLYFFVAVSALLALYIVYNCVLDFFSTNTISFQIFNLSDSQIYLLDSIEILIDMVLLVVLTIWIIKKNIKNVTIISISIWAVAIFYFFVERLFYLKA